MSDQRRQKDKTLANGLSSDSFERFGDDLTELILSFLPIADKFRFECVCKQWQRLVFNRQNKIVIHLSTPGSTLFRRQTSDPNAIKLIESVQNVENFKQLLRKLQFIFDIECKQQLNSSTNILETIVKECRYVRRFVFSGRAINQWFDNFFDKFGQRLVSLDITYSTNNFDKIFDKTPNLKKLKILKDSHYLSQTHLPKLIDIDYGSISHFNHFKTFTEKYCKQIRRLNIQYYLRSEILDVKKCLILISKYTELESLELMFWPAFTACYRDELKLIGIHCKSLKRLVTSARRPLTNGSLLSMFNHFRSLVELSICDRSRVQILGTVSELKTLPQLKNIKLYIFGHITDETFTDIDRYLPNLTAFESSGRVDNPTDQTLIAFSRLRNLQTLKMRGENFTEWGVLQIIKGCPNIQTVRINYEPTQLSVDAMSEVARSRPKHYFKLITKQINSDLLSRLVLPNNLTLYKNL